MISLRNSVLMDANNAFISIRNVRGVPRIINVVLAEPIIFPFNLIRKNLPSAMNATLIVHLAFLFSSVGVSV